MPAPSFHIPSRGRNETAFCLLASGICLLFPSPAHAQAMACILCDVWWMIHSDIGRGLATLAIVALGAGAVVGKVSWGMALMVAIGIGIMFTADTLTAMILGLSYVPCNNPC